ncbi:MAG: RedB protein [Pyrinomonadaceae bacterium]
MFRARRIKEIDGSTLPQRRKRTRAILFIGVISWVALVATGLWLLWGYENTPGIAAEAPRQWPNQSRMQRATDHPTLVMLAHPHCPCTRASIGELASIMAHSQGRLRAYVLFIKPEGISKNWEETDLWHSAANIPGVEVVPDGDGREARLFRASTSGQTVLYDPEGRLLFSGGITQSRGHFGDNAGQAAIVSLVNSETPNQTETSVFGCPLFDPQSECRTSTDERSKH